MKPIVLHISIAHRVLHITFSDSVRHFRCTGVLYIAHYFCVLHVWPRERNCLWIWWFGLQLTWSICRRATSRTSGDLDGRGLWWWSWFAQELKCATEASLPGWTFGRESLVCELWKGFHDSDSVMSEPILSSTYCVLCAQVSEQSAADISLSDGGGHTWLEEPKTLCSGTRSQLVRALSQLPAGEAASALPYTHLHANTR